MKMGFSRIAFHCSVRLKPRNVEIKKKQISWDPYAKSELHIYRYILRWLRIGYELDDRGIADQFPANTRDVSLLHSLQNSSAAHPAAYQRVPGVPSRG
jgi:hypothetical protein